MKHVSILSHEVSIQVCINFDEVEVRVPKFNGSEVVSVVMATKWRPWPSNMAVAKKEGLKVRQHPFTGMIQARPTWAELALPPGFRDSSNT